MKAMAPRMMKKLSRGLAGVMNFTLDWFYPPHCRHCSQPLTGTASRVLCMDCSRDLADGRIRSSLCPVCGMPYGAPDERETPCIACQTKPPFFDVARSVFPYYGPAGSLVRSFKFHGQFFLGPQLMKRVIALGWLPQEITGFDGVVPVPLHPKRERYRGYNQATLLAKVIARNAGVPVWRDALRRVRHTDQQALVAAARRWENVRGAFRAASGRVEGRRVLLVDDVMTTGATVGECARMLKKVGAARVNVLTLVRTLP